MRRASEATVGDHWIAQQTRTGVIGLALWCPVAGFCVGFWVVDLVPIRAVVLCAVLIGLILGHQLGRTHQYPHVGRR